MFFFTMIQFWFSQRIVLVTYGRPQNTWISYCNKCSITYVQSHGLKIYQRNEKTRNLNDTYVVTNKNSLLHNYIKGLLQLQEICSTNYNRKYFFNFSFKNIPLGSAPDFCNCSLNVWKCFPICYKKDYITVKFMNLWKVCFSFWLFYFNFFARVKVKALKNFIYFRKANVKSWGL